MFAKYLIFTAICYATEAMTWKNWPAVAFVEHICLCKSPPTPTHHLVTRLQKNSSTRFGCIVCYSQHWFVVNIHIWFYPSHLQPCVSWNVYRSCVAKSLVDCPSWKREQAHCWTLGCCAESSWVEICVIFCFVAPRRTCFFFIRDPGVSIQFFLSVIGMQ